MEGKRDIYFSIIIMVITNYGLCSPRLDPLVETNVGLIRGLKATDGDYSMFLGIPYATVDPANPFGPSNPHLGFNKTFDAFDDSKKCPQIEEFNNTIQGSLDCLRLNVYVPNNVDSKNRLPVLVWIHGGGYFRGFSGRYYFGPKYLVRHDVILVALNYRLGPYGLMCLELPEISGNQGLKDQLLALRWIKNNVEFFDGDPNQITLFGESAGARSIDYHLYYEEENLFHKVILQSGTALLTYFISEPDNTSVLKVAKQLGFETDDVKSAVSYLSSSDPHLVIKATEDADANFFLCKEKKVENVETFISEYSVNKKIPKARNTPILLGFNSNEMLYKLYDQPAEFFNNADLLKDTLMLSFNFDDDTLPEVNEIVKHFYMGDQEFNNSQMQAIADIGIDERYSHPAIRSIEKYLDNGAQSVYFYRFSYDGDRNFMKKKMNITAKGASHADDLGYLFDIYVLKDQQAEMDLTIVDRMTQMWTNFAKYSNPTPETSELLPVIWKPVTKDALYYMDINTEMELKTRPLKERMAFWDLLFKRYWTSQKGYTGEE